MLAGCCWWLSLPVPVPMSVTGAVPRSPPRQGRRQCQPGRGWQMAAGSALSCCSTGSAGTEPCSPSAPWDQRAVPCPGVAVPGTEHSLGQLSGPAGLCPWHLCPDSKQGPVNANWDAGSGVDRCPLGAGHSPRPADSL